MEKKISEEQKMNTRLLNVQFDNIRMQCSGPPVKVYVKEKDLYLGTVIQVDDVNDEIVVIEEI